MKTDITKTNNAVRANSLPNKMGGADPWVSLQALTDARIAIGRSTHAVHTRFQARARAGEGRRICAF